MFYWQHVCIQCFLTHFKNNYHQEEDDLTSLSSYDDPESDIFESGEKNVFSNSSGSSDSEYYSASEDVTKIQEKETSQNDSFDKDIDFKNPSLSDVTGKKQVISLYLSVQDVLKDLAPKKVMS